MAEMTGSLGRLLHDISRDKEWDAREALFLTFNADPGFFERSILGACRALGARVTVLADARVWDADPLALERAGHEYQLGLCSVRGAFHPKLMLLIGADRVVAAIGSGNLTLGGWQYNSELFTILRADAGHTSPGLRSLVAWLRGLAGALATTTLMRESLTRVALELEHVLAECVNGPDNTQVLHTLTEPLLTQLPIGPVDTLHFGAPFLDTRGEAIERLLERLDPNKATLIVQEHKTSASAEALASLADRYSGRLEVVADSTKRYRHAKFIEARSGKEVWTLTGSANLSAAALLQSASHSGNVELAVLNRAGGVWPDPGIESDALNRVGAVTQIRQLAFAVRSDEASRPQGPTLAGATLREGVLLVELTAVARHACDVQFTTDPVAPGWRAVGAILVGEKHVEVKLGIVGDAALIRLAWDVDDVHHVGPVLPINLHERVTARPMRTNATGTGRQPRDADDLLGSDLDFLIGFQAQISHVQQEMKTLRGLRERSSDAADGDSGSADDHRVTTGWLWDLERTARSVHGPGLAAFALGLPALPTVGRWESFDSDEVGELDGDASLVDSPEMDDAAQPAVTSHRKQPERLRRQRRDRIAEYARWDGPMSVVTSLTATRIALCFYCAGNWDDEDPSAIKHLAALFLRARSGAAHTEHLTEVSALAAVAMTCIRSRVDHSSGGPVTSTWRDFEKQIGAVDLSPVTDELLQEYCKYVSTAAGSALDARLIREDWSALAKFGTLRTLILMAEQRELEFEVVGACGLLVKGPFSDPASVAFDMATSTDGDVGVWVDSTEHPRAAFCCLRDQDVFLARFIGSAETWEHFNATRGLSVLRDSIRQGERSRFRVPHGMLSSPVPDAIDAAFRAGFGGRWAARRGNPEPSHET